MGLELVGVHAKARMKNRVTMCEAQGKIASDRERGRRISVPAKERQSVRKRVQKGHKNRICNGTETKTIEKKIKENPSNDILLTKL